MQGTLLVLLTLLIPAVCAPLMLLIRQPVLRKVVVSAAACAMIAVAVALGVCVLTQGSIVISTEAYPWVPAAVTVIDAVTLIVILFFGFSLKEWKVVVPSLFQAASFIYLEMINKPAETQNIVVIDNLSLILVLISSILGR
jgi:hypothetical protein